MLWPNTNNDRELPDLLRWQCALRCERISLHLQHGAYTAWKESAQAQRRTRVVSLVNGCRVVVGCTRVHAMALDSPVLRAPPYGCDVVTHHLADPHLHRLTPPWLRTCLMHRRIASQTSVSSTRRGCCRILHTTSRRARTTIAIAELPHFSAVSSLFLRAPPDALRAIAHRSSHTTSLAMGTKAFGSKGLAMTTAYRLVWS